MDKNLKNQMPRHTYQQDAKNPIQINKNNTEHQFN